MEINEYLLFLVLVFLLDSHTSTSSSFNTLRKMAHPFYDDGQNPLNHVAIRLPVAQEVSCQRDRVFEDLPKDHNTEACGDVDIPQFTRLQFSQEQQSY